eukprot:5026043-Amphidinium_carterae.1
MEKKMTTKKMTETSATSSQATGRGKGRGKKGLVPTEGREPHPPMVVIRLVNYHEELPIQNHFTGSDVRRALKYMED